MGITGLLPQLRSVTSQGHIGELKGETVGIDGYVWLHRGVFSCARDLCLGNPTTRYVGYFLNKINLLRRNGVIPFVVFDGGYLPEKAGKEKEREQKREKNLKAAMAFLAEGNNSKAENCFQKAADVTPLMAWEVIKHLKKLGVQYIVAPYEADSQLVYLNTTGKISAIITEDSDLLTFGASRLLLKMDSAGGCNDIQLRHFTQSQELDMSTWSHEMFQHMCIFAGCDYLPSLSGFGIKRAYQVMHKHRHYTKAIRAIKFEGKYKVPIGYEENFRKAMLTFKHQRVYCPARKALVHLRQVPSSNMDDLDFVGPDIPSEIAEKIATGQIDPITKESFEEMAKRMARRPKKAVPKPPKAGRGRIMRGPIQKNKIKSYFMGGPKSKKKKKEGEKKKTKSWTKGRTNGKTGENQSTKTVEIRAPFNQGAMTSLGAFSFGCGSGDPLESMAAAHNLQAEQNFSGCTLPRVTDVPHPLDPVGNKENIPPCPPCPSVPKKWVPPKSTRSSLHDPVAQHTKRSKPKQRSVSSSFFKGRPKGESPTVILEAKIRTYERKRPATQEAAPLSNYAHNATGGGPRKKFKGFKAPRANMQKPTVSLAAFSYPGGGGGASVVAPIRAPDSSLVQAERVTLPRKRFGKAPVTSAYDPETYTVPSSATIVSNTKNKMDQFRFQESADEYNKPGFSSHRKSLASLEKFRA